jgi:zinc D-Ala-D-Ala dipeptidase
MNIKFISFFLYSLFFYSMNLSAQKSQTSLPNGFVYMDELDPSIIFEMRYAGDHNFIGKPVNGYLAPKCILSKEAAQALANVQTELKQFSMSLKIYDCYRPQQAVDHFVAWAKDINDTKMKNEFYPKVDKKNLFKDGYIARKSGHSRGSTVDITIVALPVSGQEKYQDGEKLKECYLPASKRFKDNSLDFGTGYDCFDALSHTANPEASQVQKRNRLLLKSMMEKNGFKGIAVEWWHFTLVNEPYPDKYFDFAIL